MNLHRIFVITAIATAIATITACSASAVESPQIREVVEGNTDFAFEMYTELAEFSADENFFFSPHSISVALAMTYAGARGETAEAMADTLHFNLPQETLHPSFSTLDSEITGRENVELYTANSLWGQEGYQFLQEFLDLMDRYYNAGMNLVDFVGDTENARVTINDWVYEKTREKIADLIPRNGVTPITRLVLVNAIYFKADWLTQFDPDHTYDGRFRLLDGERVDARMMSMNAEFPFVQAEDYSAIELPYSGEDLSMLIILPDIDKFSEIEDSLNQAMVEDIIVRLRETELDSVVLPKFEMTSFFPLASILSSMGMGAAFGGSDFSGMDGTRNLFISEVFHKAYVKVYEEGTEAAAATAVVMELAEMPGGPAFIADHPFIFLIRDRETGAILFMGRMMDPSTAQVSEESGAE